MFLISLGVRLTETVNNYYGLKSTFIIERNSRGSEKNIKKFFIHQAQGLLNSIPEPRQRTSFYRV